MSTEYHDIYESGVVSNCCSAAVYSNQERCVDCGEHCGLVYEADEKEYAEWWDNELKTAENELHSDIDYPIDYTTHVDMIEDL